MINIDTFGIYVYKLYIEHINIILTWRIFGCYARSPAAASYFTIFLYNILHKIMKSTSGKRSKNDCLRLNWNGQDKDDCPLLLRTTLRLAGSVSPGERFLIAMKLHVKPRREG